MSIQRQGWVTLDSIIYDYINESEQSNSKYVKLFHIAFRVMEVLGLDFFYQIKSVKLPINDNKTITLPTDFIRYNKLGVLNGLGQLVPLKYNEALTTYNDQLSTRIADTSSSNFVNFYSYSSPIFFNYWNGETYSNLYGIVDAGFYGGSFKIDSQNNVILLDSSFNWNGLVLEYTASPQSGEDYYVPVEFREAIISWLAWKDIINMPNSRKGSLGEKRDRRHEFFEQRRLAIRQYRPFYIDQAYMENQETQRLVVKA